VVRADQHRDYAEENRHLHDTLRIIQGELRQTQEPRESSPPYRNAYLEVARITTEHAANMRQALAEPYFARIDFVREGEYVTQPLYIGKFGVNGADRSPVVFDWHAPIAQLYYKRQWQRATYTAPRSAISGDVTLRRNYRIYKSQLDEIVDEVPMRSELAAPPSDGSETTDKVAAPINTFLHDVLAAPHDTKLQDIVATIQPEQYSLIEAPLHGVMVVQGVAGSGKTSIALHRLAYLLYQHRDTITPEQVLVIGPSALFLQSVSDILPGLGVHGIRQITFAEWAESLLGSDIRVDPSIASMEHLFDHAFEQQIGRTKHRLLTVAASHLYRLKGSMRMASLLKGHLAATKKRLPSLSSSISVTYTMPDESDVAVRVLSYAHPGRIPLSLSSTEVEHVVEQVLTRSAGDDLRLNVLRERCVERIVEQLWLQFKHHPLYGWPRDKEEQKTWETRDIKRSEAFRATMTDLVRSTLDTWWPVVTPSSCYSALLGDKNALMRAASEASSELSVPIHEWEVEMLLTPEVLRRGYRWQVEDLAPLCYISLMLTNLQKERYDHIVVDEVQDLSPLELYLLSQHARGGSMTLVGDVAQGLGVRGIRTLSEVDDALRGVPITHQLIDISYRSTCEITEYANRLLTHVTATDSLLSPARPVARHGRVPNLVKCTSRRHMLNKVAEVVREAQNTGSRSVAVICKTSAATNEVKEALGLRDVPNQEVLAGAPLTSEQVVVLPVFAAKGLEFDTVVVVDVSDKTYMQREYDAKLLYVALTRALHSLYLLWAGTISPLLTQG